MEDKYTSKYLLISYGDEGINATLNVICLYIVNNKNIYVHRTIDLITNNKSKIPVISLINIIIKYANLKKDDVLKITCSKQKIRFYRQVYKNEYSDIFRSKLYMDFYLNRLCEYPIPYNVLDAIKQLCSIRKQANVSDFKVPKDALFFGPTKTEKETNRLFDQIENSNCGFNNNENVNIYDDNKEMAINKKEENIIPFNNFYDKSLLSLTDDLLLTDDFYTF